VLEVVADRVQFLNRGTKSGGSSEPGHEPMEDEGAPQAQAAGSEEDIPF
jgi:single-stranded DNA-binding protein